MQWNGFLEPSPRAETAVASIGGQIHDGYNLKGVQILGKRKDFLVLREKN